MMPDIHDIFCIAGAILMAYGAYQIYPPAGFITLGVLFFIAGLATAAVRREGERDADIEDTDAG